MCPCTVKGPSHRLSGAAHTASSAVCVLGKNAFLCLQTMSTLNSSARMSVRVPVETSSERLSTFAKTVPPARR